MIINELSLQISPLEEQAKKAKIYKENKEKLESIEVGILASDITTLNDEYTIIKNEKTNLEDKLAVFSTDDSKERVELENEKLERTKLDEEISAMQKNLLYLGEEINTLNSKKELLKEIQNNIRSLTEEKLKLENDVNSISLKLTGEVNFLNEEKNKLNSLNNEYNNVNIRINNYNREIGELSKNRMDLNNRKEILEFNIENMTKVPFAVRNVINNPTLKGVVNRIGSLIETPNEYAMAIDTALGGSVNNVVTRTDEDAKEAINYLKRNNKGRVTFFPMNLIKAKAIDSETLETVKSMSGYAGVASNLVKYDDEFKNIIMNQLGNIIVATNIDEALKISKKIGSRYRIVTLDGEIVHVGGSLTGGSKNETGAMSEKTELDKILSQIKICEIALEEKEKILKEAKDSFEIITDQIYKQNIKILENNEKLEIIKKQLEETKNKFENTVDELNALTGKNEETELDKILNEFYNKEKEKEELTNKMDTLEKKRKSLIEDIELKETTLNKNNSKVREMNERINELNVKEARLSVNLDNLLNRLSEEYNLTYERARNNYELTVDINEARVTMNEAKKVLKSLGEVNLGSIEEYERVSKRYNFLNGQKEDLVASEQNLLGIIQNMDDVMIDKFATTFKKVNQEFTKVFKELFGGGDAHLEMTDPTNILETGIEIKAYPPGKKPGALSLLSGGEMTLTAISCNNES